METIFIKNARKDTRCSVKLIKMDACCACIHLAGAVFDLLQYDEISGRYRLLQSGLTTGCEGTLLVEHLDAGWYKFVETRAPQGYWIGRCPETCFAIRPGDGCHPKVVTVCNCPCAPCVCCTPRCEDSRPRHERIGLLPETVRYLENKSYREIRSYFEDYQ